MRISVLLLATVSFMCSEPVDDPNDAGDDAGLDDGGNDSGTDGGNDDADEPGSPWDALDWRPLSEAGDPADDCHFSDSDCEADILQLYYAVDNGVLYFDLHFDGPFNALGNGSYELFIFPPAAVATGHAIRNVGGTMTFWDADCSGTLKHTGCHWSSIRELDTFQDEWVSDSRYICQMDLSVYGWETLPEMLLGAAAAPHLIEASAEFTDRYPDDLLVTATDVRGLQTVPLQ